LKNNQTVVEDVSGPADAMKIVGDALELHRVRRAEAV
jgi:hypothetical protein